MEGIKNTTILLVEDEFILATDEALVLEGFGYKVLAAHNGEEAVSMTLGDPDIDLILMDIDLGKGMDGTEAARKILDNREIPIVFLSSHTEKEIVDRTEKITSYGYIVKNSGETILNASIKMAFRLFAAHMREREAHRALRESEMRFRRIYENMAIGVAQVSLDFTIFQANEAYCRMLGYTEEELKGKHLKDITHPEVLEENLSKQAALGRGEIDHYQMEKRFIHREGKVVYGVLDANLIRDGEGKPSYFLGSVFDVTERKMAEQALRESQTRYRALFQQSPYGIVIIDPETGAFVEFNDQVCRQLGYSREEFARLKVFDLEVLENAEETRAHFQKVIREGNDSFETLQRNRAGELCAVQVSAQIIEVSGVSLYHCIWRDITRSKEIENRLKESEGILKRSQRLASVGGWSWDVLNRTDRKSTRLNSSHRT